MPSLIYKTNPVNNDFYPNYAPAILFRVKTPAKFEASQIFLFVIVVKRLNQKSSAFIGFLTLKQISNA